MKAIPLLLAALAAPNPSAETGLLYFTGKYCVYCQQTSPIVSHLQRQHARIRTVDVEREPNLVKRFGIVEIPAFVLVIDGRVEDKLVGAVSENRLRRLLAKIPAEPEAPANAETADKWSERPSSRRSQSTAPERENKRGVSIPFLDLSRAREKLTDLVTADEPESGQLPEDAVVRANLGRNDIARRTAGDAGPLATTVRIRIKDPGGTSYGSGTVIDSRPGNTLILTCGHIFRGLDGESLLEVDLFADDSHETYVGKAVRYDLDADVGLLSIPTEEAIPAARVAQAKTRLMRGDAVTSVGCSSGDHPTLQQLKITALNRYQGPDNIECTGVPVQGRSGGGLFNERGEVIGVCIAADPRDRRGLYAGLKAVHALLDEAGLARLYAPAPREKPSRESLAVPVAQSDTQQPPRPQPREEEPDEEWVVDQDQLAEMMAGAETLNSATSSRPEDEIPGISENPRDLRTADGFGNRLPDFVADGAEVVCIVRPAGNPDAESRVVIINRASRKFLAYLQDELSEGSRHTAQLMKIPMPDTPATWQPRARSSVVPTAGSSGTRRPATGPKRYRRTPGLFD